MTLVVEVEAWPAQRLPSGTNRSGSTEAMPGSSPASTSDDIGTVRDSRTLRDLAVFVRIRNSQVLKDERLSNLSMPSRTPTHVSWTTSSATARVWTNSIATRSIEWP